MNPDHQRDQTERAAALAALEAPLTWTPHPTDHTRERADIIAREGLWTFAIEEYAWASYEPSEWHLRAYRDNPCSKTPILECGTVTLAMAFASLIVTLDDIPKQLDPWIEKPWPAIEDTP